MHDKLDEIDPTKKVAVLGPITPSHQFIGLIVVDVRGDV